MASYPLAGNGVRLTIVDAQASACSRVVVADDDVLLREGLASLLERSDFEVVGQAGDADELVELIREHEPDLVIADIRMPPTHSTEGLEAAHTIREEFPEIGILVLSGHVEIEHATELLATGQRIGYLLKGRVVDVDEFIASLRRIAAGGSVVDPGLVQTLVKVRRGGDPLSDLTAREREVLALMAEGRSTRASPLSSGSPRERSRSTSATSSPSSISPRRRTTTVASSRSSRS
jgi:DNA-binding NarL/FixJ family response regulator